MSKQQGTLPIKMKRLAPVLDRDPTEVGFEIPGHKLRWIAARKQEDKWGRIWQALRKEQLSEEAIRSLEAYNPSTFATGNVIRRGDMILAYASNELVEALRTQIDHDSKSRKSQIYNVPGVSKNVRILKNETSMSKTTAADFESGN